jgi:hypothetical protein
MLRTFLSLPAVGANIKSFSWLYWTKASSQIEITHQCGFVLSMHTLQQMQSSSEFQLTIVHRLVTYERDIKGPNITNHIPFALSCIFHARLQSRGVETMADLNEVSDPAYKETSVRSLSDSMTHTVRERFERQLVEAHARSTPSVKLDGVLALEKEFKSRFAVLASLQKKMEDYVKVEKENKKASLEGRTEVIQVSGMMTLTPGGKIERALDEAHARSTASDKLDGVLALEKDFQSLFEVFACLRVKMEDYVEVEKKSKNEAMCQKLLVDIPGLMCSINQEIADDPVTAADGNTYNRSAIEKWFVQCRKENKPTTSPKTRAAMSDHLVTNTFGRKLVADIMKHFKVV